MYKATEDRNTEFGNFKKGDLVSDAIGERYNGFEKVEETKEVKSKTTPVKKDIKPKKKKDVKEELLIDDSSEVQVETKETKETKKA